MYYVVFFLISVILNKMCVCFDIDAYFFFCQFMLKQKKIKRKTLSTKFTAN